MNIRTGRMRRRGSEHKRSQRGHEGGRLELLGTVYFHYRSGSCSQPLQKCSNGSITKGQSITKDLSKNMFPFEAAGLSVCYPRSFSACFSEVCSMSVMSLNANSQHTERKHIFAAQRMVPLMMKQVTLTLNINLWRPEW